MKVIISALILLTGCTSNGTDQKIKFITAQDSLVSTIVGTWGGDNNKPFWEIKKDSMHYYNQKKSYYYLIHDKDMIVLYKDGPYMLRNIHTVNDTLFFEINYEGAVIKAFRIK